MIKMQPLLKENTNPLPVKYHGRTYYIDGDAYQDEKNIKFFVYQDKNLTNPLKTHTGGTWMYTREDITDDVLGEGLGKYQIGSALEHTRQLMKILKADYALYSQMKTFYGILLSKQGVGAA